MKLGEVLEFIKRQNLAVVSTIDAAGKPQSAVVEFGEFDDLTIIIHTLTTSRKYKNLTANPHVAIVIGWDEDITVQMSATGRVLVGAELEQAKAAYADKNPRAKKWEAKKDIAYLAFTPTWIRYADLNPKPWIIKEFEL